MKETEIKTTNLNLAALVSGHASETPIIALHGWLDNAASFVPLARHLPGIQLIAIDFPGHGKSDHRSGANAYHFIDYAADVLLAADALELEQFSLLGHSLGAGVAATIAAVVPERISRLAMVEGLVPFTAPADELLPQFRKHVDETRKPASPVRIYNTTKQAALARQKAGDMLLESAALIAERNLTETANGYAWRTDRKLNRPSPIYLVEDQVRTYLKMIKCEALLIQSDRGILKNWPSLAGWHPLVSNLQVIDIEGGHHCHMDDPVTVARHVLPFLSCA